MEEIKRSTECKYLERRIRELKNNFDFKQSINGISKRQSDRLKGLRLLCHAEFEDYFESVALKLLTLAEKKWTDKHIANYHLASLLICHEKIEKKDDIQTKVYKIITDYRQLVRDNHGIKEHREVTLKNYLSGLKKEYNYILIDCMPSLGMLTINALAAADSVIIPVQAHYLPLKGMAQLTKTIGRVQRQINPSLKVDGVVLTLADMRTNLARATADSLKQNYGRIVKVYKTVIPVSVKAAETSAAGKSIYAYDKNGAAAKAYADFTREVMRDGERQRNKNEATLSR